MSTDTHGVEGVLGPLELELHVLLSCLIRVLGTELRPSARAARALSTKPYLQPVVLCF